MDPLRLSSTLNQLARTSRSSGEASLYYPRAIDAFSIHVVTKHTWPLFRRSDPARTDHAVVILSTYWLLIRSMGTVRTRSNEGQPCILNSNAHTRQK
jgi:hypothetical protein